VIHGLIKKSIGDVQKQDRHIFPVQILSVGDVFINEKHFTLVKHIVFAVDMLFELSFRHITQFNKIMAVQGGKEALLKRDPVVSKPVPEQEAAECRTKGKTIDGSHAVYRDKILKLPGTVGVDGKRFPQTGIPDSIGDTGTAIQKQRNLLYGRIGEHPGNPHDAENAVGAEGPP
jgi:hypothetical protein